MNSIAENGKTNLKSVFAIERRNTISKFVM
jgi:hypothetical protein